MKATNVILLVLLLLIIVSISSLIIECKSVKPIYGIDDRTDEYKIPEGIIKNIGQKTGAIMEKELMTKNKDGSFTLVPIITLQEGYNLCDTEPFLNQPIPAFCSGTLIGKTQFLTAAHCIIDNNTKKQVNLEDIIVVFDFFMIDENTWTERYDANKVYNVTKIKYFELEEYRDIVILELDKEVTFVTPVTNYGYFNEVVEGEEIFMVSHPSGIPRKYDVGNVIELETEVYWIAAALDAFHGNSGSGIFNMAGELFAILISGEDDYDLNGNCMINHVCDDSCGEILQSVCVLPSEFGFPSCDAVRPSYTPTPTPNPTSESSETSDSSSQMISNITISVIIVVGILLF